MDDPDDFFSLKSTKISIILIGIGVSALIVTTYHCLSMKWCSRRRRGDGQNQRSQQQQHHHSSGHEMLVRLGSFGNSTANLIPTHKYRKGTEDDEMCPVCLSQFEEGEELRTLPECLHSYHAPCIDMWLNSHTNCPMCRTDATPLPLPNSEIAHHRQDSDSNLPDSGPLLLDSGMLQNNVIQSRTLL